MKKKEYDPCSPCLCLNSTCKECVFGGKELEEREALLKEIVVKRSDKSILRSFNFHYGIVSF